MPEASGPSPASALPRTKKSKGESRAGLDEIRTAVLEIDVAVNNLWNLGQNIVVGWMPDADGVQICVAPFRRVAEKAARNPRLFDGARKMDAAAFARASKDVKGRVLHLPLPLPVGDGQSSAGIDPEVIDSVIGRYSIMRTEHRAVMLFDIVDFATSSPVEQLAQFVSLEHSICAAGQAMNEAGLPVELARSTAGDGFIYVWNRYGGLDADLRAYAAMMLILADNARARRAASVDGGIVPVLRTSFTVGSHYSYHQMEANRPRALEYATGQVTITLARIVGKALAGQVLVGAFARPVDAAGNSIEAALFIARAEKLLTRLTGAKLDEQELLEVRSLLGTGARNGVDPGIVRYLIEDKHGLQHEVFNLRGKAAWLDSETVEFGLRGDDLGEFKSTPIKYQIPAMPAGRSGDG